jgi:rhodanese-related sulfurtransferase
MSHLFQAPDPAKGHAILDYFLETMSLPSAPAELDRLRKQDTKINVVDVRSEADFCTEHIPGAVCLPPESWESGSGLYPDVINVLYSGSATCPLAENAVQLFSKRGLPVVKMTGGLEAWKAQGLAVEQVHSPLPEASDRAKHAGFHRSIDRSTS